MKLKRSIILAAALLPLALHASEPTGVSPRVNGAATSSNLQAVDYVQRDGVADLNDYCSADGFIANSKDSRDVLYCADHHWISASKAKAERFTVKIVTKAGVILQTIDLGCDLDGTPAVYQLGSTDEAGSRGFYLSVTGRDGDVTIDAHAEAVDPKGHRHVTQNFASGTVHLDVGASMAFNHDGYVTTLKRIE